MKELVCVKPGSLEYKDVPPPVLQPGHAILKIKRIGICGTDLHAYKGTQPFFTYPRTLGHELAADLIEADGADGFVPGEAVTFIPYFNCGKCIACRNNKPNCCVNIKVFGVHIDGGMAEYISVPSYALVKGEGLSYEQLALVEPLAIGAHGVRRAAIANGEFVLVIGAGPIGLGTMQFAKIAGANVIASEMRPIITGKMAPPTIDIMINEEPSFVFEPSPRMPREKIVGNMIDIKNSTPVNAYTEILPCEATAPISNIILMML